MIIYQYYSTQYIKLFIYHNNNYMFEHSCTIWPVILYCKYNICN